MLNTTHAIPQDSMGPGMRPNIIPGIELDRPIGSGATSTVFMGFEVDQPTKRYAIKFLSPILGKNPDAMKRWEREAKLLSGLEHPNIVRAYKSGVAENRPYLVMEFLQGESLMDRLRRKGKLPESDVLHIARSCLSALVEANKQNIIHRDIKPANVIWLNDGSIKVMDFGLAKFSDDVDITSTGTILGTPIYLSPEQAAGERHLGIGSDLYALGSTLFHLAAGRPPFTDLNSSLLLTRKITDDVPDIRHIDAEISAGIALLLNALCARRLEDRIETPAKALALLDQIERGDISTRDLKPPARGDAPIFRDAPPIDEALIARGSVLETVAGDSKVDAKPLFMRPDEVLFYEDGDGRECYLLVSGSVDILKAGRTIATISEPGNFIGEMSPLRGAPRSATVVSKDDTVLFRIEEAEFRDFFQRHPRIALNLAQSLAERLENTSRQLNEASTIISTLNRHVREMGDILAMGKTVA